MGSYCGISFDDIEVCVAKSVVPDEFCAVFQESDRLVRKSLDPEDEDCAVVYETTREIILARLSLLGCTAPVARERLTTWIEAQRAIWDEYSSKEGGEWAAEPAKVLRTLTPEIWYARVPQALATRYTQDEPSDEIDRLMREGEDSPLWFDGYGSLLSLRALLDACPDVRTVTLDISDLIGGGWLSEDERICEDRRKDSGLEPRPLAPTVILAEGSSDIEVLQQSLPVLFPEWQNYFSFFNHDELEKKVDGGANYLVKFLTAFAAARAPFRMVAVFDNDTAGIQAYDQANALGLPDNIIVVRLPDIGLARTYPTVGPQGHHIVDVNGKAASIELYLGREALMVDGELRPVQWKGYIQAANAYQGEVTGKREVKRAFLTALPNFSSPVDARAAFPELVSVWEEIYRVVERSAEMAQKKLHGRTRIEV